MSNSAQPNFDWISFYEELANKLVGWRNRQSELIDFIETLRGQGLVVTPLEDHMDDGIAALLTEIDPFTFYGIFNRGILETHRINILKAIKVKFDISAEIPTGFSGIPLLNNQKSWFFAYKVDRQPNDIDKLWHVFSEALKPNPFSSAEFEKAFDEALGVRNTKYNLTMGLFWIRPHVFLNLDKTMRDYLSPLSLGSELSFKTYSSILEKVRETHPDFAELSEAAYQNPKSVGITTSFDGVSKPEESLNSLISKCSLLRSKMGLKHIAASPTLEFTNTGGKAFIITLRALHQSLIDIRNNISDFARCSRYDESLWRTLCSTYFTDKATNALSTVQSLPLFITISKLVHTINDLPASSYHDSVLDFNPDKFDKAIAFLSSEIPDEATLLKLKKPSKALSTAGGVNTIYYGAPGTGKSYSINSIIKPEKSIRVVFHADTQYTDFVGCLKPTKIGKEITYVFRPGPFSLALVNALKDPGDHHWLIIEEINRAPAAAVFGEIFQLLDRDEFGKSKYRITPSDPDMIAYFESELGAVVENGQLYIPENLSILATMNSSDQAVMPLDTAFKRRWSFKYIPLNFDTCANGNFILFVPIRGNIEVPWKLFATVVNNILSDLEIPEDRHLGPFFLTDHELKDLKSQYDSLTGKIFMYLWDDVLRHGFRPELFRSDIKTYGQLTFRNLRNEHVFSDRFYSELESELLLITTTLEKLSESEVGE